MKDDAPLMLPLLYDCMLALALPFLMMLRLLPNEL